MIYSMSYGIWYYPKEAGSGAKEALLCIKIWMGKVWKDRHSPFMQISFIGSRCSYLAAGFIQNTALQMLLSILYLAAHKNLAISICLPLPYVFYTEI
jgi:hypothetical protein